MKRFPLTALCGRQQSSMGFMATTLRSRPFSKTAYIPPDKVESLFELTKSNKFGRINSPVAGARVQAELPIGRNPFQLYSVATPNGQKIGILLEELGIAYDAHKIDLNGDQFKTRFVELNPNSKIPIAMDIVKGKPIRLFESGSIMLYLAEKYNKFIPTDPLRRTEMLNWLFWQVSNLGPTVGACFGHFFCYAPDDQHQARDYGLGRYGMEVQRLMSVLDEHLLYREFIMDRDFTIADMAIFPWVLQLRRGYRHKAGNAASHFLSLEANYPAVMGWCDRILERPAVLRGLRVCEWSKEYSKPWELKKDAIK